MWNYSNVKPLQECFYLIVQLTSKYSQKVTTKITDKFKCVTIYYSDVPSVFILWDFKQQKITVTSVVWNTTKTGKKYKRITGRIVYKYGMAYNSSRRKYELLPNDFYINGIHNYYPSLNRVTKQEAIGILQKKYGKTFINRYRDDLNGFPYSLIQRLDKKSFERVRQTVAKCGVLINTEQVLLLNPDIKLWKHVYIIRDYTILCKQLNKKIVVGLSERRYKELHDEYTKEFNQKTLSKLKNRRLNIAKELRFNLESKGIYLIKDTKTLLEEGIEQHHCVGSYSTQVNKGYCAIYTTTINGIKYTIELVRHGKSVKINQMMTKYNKPAPHQLWIETEKLFIS